MEKVETVISGQSCKVSNSSSRKFVRKRATLEGPGAEAVGWGLSEEVGFKLFDRRLRDLARDILLVEDDMLEAVGSHWGVITCYHQLNAVW